jgi:hypothetical protein
MFIDYLLYQSQIFSYHIHIPVGERGDIWHTFHVIIFHIFPVHVKMNIAALMVSNTLGLQSDLHKFDAISKE